MVIISGTMMIDLPLIVINLPLLLTIVVIHGD